MGIPSFSGKGALDRARGRHLTAANTLSAFGRFNQWGGGGGGAVAFGQFNQSGVRAFGRFNQWAVEAQLRGGAHVCKQGGGGHSPTHGDTHDSASPAPSY